MKIVQINAVYGLKSTGTIVKDIHLALKKQGIESYVFWGTECKNNERDENIMRIGNTIDHKIHAFFRRIDGKQAWHSKYYTKKLICQLYQIKPDVVHLHNLHSNYIHLPTLLKYLAKNKIGVLITIHDCWFMTGYCMHYHLMGCEKWKSQCNDCPMVNKRIKKTVLNMFKSKEKLFSEIECLAVNGVSRWTADAAKQSTILKNADYIETIYNWVDTEYYKPVDEKENVLEKYKIPIDKYIILGVSQGWSEVKGLKEFLAISEHYGDKVHIVLVGENTHQKKNDNITFVGYIKDRDEMRKLYSASDLFVNPSKMETFGLVNVESLACGTPVVAYDNTGISEIVDDKCGLLVKTGDVVAMIQAIETMIKMGKSLFTYKCRQSVVERFDKKTQIEKYLNLYKKINKENDKER